MRIRHLIAGVAVAGGLAALPHVASAQSSDPYQKPTSEVQGTEFTKTTVADGAQVKGEQVSRGLAFTGSDIAELTILGVALTGLGTVVVRATRRRTPAA